MNKTNSSWPIPRSGHLSYLGVTTTTVRALLAATPPGLCQRQDCAGSRFPNSAALSLARCLPRIRAVDDRCRLRRGTPFARLRGSGRCPFVGRGIFERCQSLQVIGERTPQWESRCFRKSSGGVGVPSAAAVTSERPATCLLRGVPCTQLATRACPGIDCWLPCNLACMLCGLGTNVPWYVLREEAT